MKRILAVVAGLFVALFVVCAPVASAAPRSDTVAAPAASWHYEGPYSNQNDCYRDLDRYAQTGPVDGPHFTSWGDCYFWAFY